MHDDLNVFDGGCEPKRGPKAALVLVRRVLRRVMRPWSSRLAEVLRNVAGRLDAHDRGLEIHGQKLDGLTVQLHGLSQEYHELNCQFQSRVVQLNALSEAIRRFSIRLEDLDATLQSFHWDHVAQARRLAVLEDLLAATTVDARQAIVDGGSRPLLAFPGLDQNGRSDREVG